MEGIITHCLPSLVEMQRISREDLENRVDEILQVMNKENIGYVITDNGKEDAVICPARWLKCENYEMNEENGCESKI